MEQSQRSNAKSKGEEMALSATVRLELRPQEFDLLRRALDLYTDTKQKEARDEVNPRNKADARTQSLLANDLLQKLNN